MPHGLDGVEHIEQVADLMPDMNEVDSSSAGVADDTGPGMHAIAIEVPDHLRADRVRELAGTAAGMLDASVELVDEFRPPAVTARGPDRRCPARSC